MDPIAAKNVALTTAAKAAKTPDELGKLVDSYLALSDAAVATDDYENADKAATGAAQAARRANSTPSAAKVATRMKELADLKAKCERVKKANETLVKDPANGAANLEVGLFYCFTKGDWNTGISFLAKSSDPTLKAIATREGAQPTESDARAEIADGWWERRKRLLSQSLYTPAFSGYPRR